ncbi:hypothetical protein [Cohnella fermenti]|uniref:DUF697 domain-containing protein n=1 Tax=Cohnella fermenti TaxID=2565925 RepID=A0A4S4BIP1_9BACL|nr:hypothetical protein [Cohnella fermenti]THF73868.1 hypothetical protein E6C55_27550 [Cohnella fermenti]
MIPKTINELNQIRAECEGMVNMGATVSAMLTVVPVPGVDTVGDVAIMLELLSTINKRFGLSPEQIEQLDFVMKEKVLAIAITTGSQLIGKLIISEIASFLLKKYGTRILTSQFLKFIPLVGQAISAGISFGALKSLGNSHINDCYKICEQLILGDK